MNIREAVFEDLSAIVNLLNDDDLGKKREDPERSLQDNYTKAFIEISADPNQMLLVLDDGNSVIGTMQLTFIRNMTYTGGLRAQIEGVRVSKERRGEGLGEIMFKWAIMESKNRGAHLIQLTTDQQRTGVVDFYKHLGFKNSHEGMKLHLV